MKNVLLYLLLGFFVLGCNQGPEKSDTERKQSKKEQVEKRDQNAQKNKKRSNANSQKNKKSSKANDQKNKKDNLLKLNAKWENDGLSKKQRAQKVYGFVVKDKKDVTSFEEQLARIMKEDKSEDEALDLILKKCLSIGKQSKK